MDPKTIRHLIVKEKVVQQIFLGKYSTLTITAVVFELQWIYSTVRISK